MLRTQSPAAREQRAILDLHDALGSSLNIRTVLENAYAPLLDLVDADYAALGISPSGRPEDYEWIAPEIPPAFFAAYPEMAPHDFVRTNVARRLNTVLRDEDMISRADLENNMMYYHARKAGVRLEQVMAVMLHIDNRWQSGLSLYRDGKRPFSEHERDALQRETSVITIAVRLCHLAGAAADGNAALEALLADRREAIVLVTPPATTVERSIGATHLIDKWFPRHEWRNGHLPALLAVALARAAVQGEPTMLAIEGNHATLRTSFLPLSGCIGKPKWMLRLEEVPHAIPMPHAWRSILTPQQQEVTSRVLAWEDNPMIAGELDCALATVKAHMRNIFDKLGVDTRAQLIARALQLGRGDPLTMFRPPDVDRPST